MLSESDPDPAIFNGDFPSCKFRTWHCKHVVLCKQNSDCDVFCHFIILILEFQILKQSNSLQKSLKSVIFHTLPGTLMVNGLNHIEYALLEIWWSLLLTHSQNYNHEFSIFYLQNDRRPFVFAFLNFLETQRYLWNFPALVIKRIDWGIRLEHEPLTALLPYLKKFHISEYWSELLRVSFEYCRSRCLFLQLLSTCLIPSTGL